MEDIGNLIDDPDLSETITDFMDDEVGVFDNDGDDSKLKLFSSLDDAIANTNGEILDNKVSDINREFESEIQDLDKKSAELENEIQSLDKKSTSKLENLQKNTTKESPKESTIAYIKGASSSEHMLSLLRLAKNAKLTIHRATTTKLGNILIFFEKAEYKEEATKLFNNYFSFLEINAIVQDWNDNLEEEGKLHDGTGWNKIDCIVTMAGNQHYTLVDLLELVEKNKMEQPTSKMGKKGSINLLFSTPSIQKEAFEILQNTKISSPEITDKNFVIFIENQKNDTIENFEELRSKIENAVDEYGTKMPSLLVDAGRHNNGTFWFKFHDGSTKREGKKIIREHYITEEDIDIHERPTIEFLTDLKKYVQRKGRGAFNLIATAASRFGLFHLVDLSTAFAKHKRIQQVKRAYTVYGRSVLRAAILLSGKKGLTSNQKDRCWDWLKACKKIAGDKSSEFEVQAIMNKKSNENDKKSNRSRHLYPNGATQVSKYKLPPSIPTYHNYLQSHLRPFSAEYRRHNVEHHRSRHENFFLHLPHQYREKYLPRERWDNNHRTRHYARDLSPPRKMPSSFTDRERYHSRRDQNPLHLSSSRFQSTSSTYRRYRSAALSDDPLRMSRDYASQKMRHGNRAPNLYSVPNHNIKPFLHRNVSNLSSSRGIFSKLSPSLPPHLRSMRAMHAHAFS